MEDSLGYPIYMHNAACQPQHVGDNRLTNTWATCVCPVDKNDGDESARGKISHLRAERSFDQSSGPHWEGAVDQGGLTGYLTDAKRLGSSGDDQGKRPLPAALGRHPLATEAGAIRDRPRGPNTLLSNTQIGLLSSDWHDETTPARNRCRGGRLPKGPLTEEHNPCSSKIL
jgi:hypothetical protein